MELKKRFVEPDNKLLGKDRETVIQELERMGIGIVNAESIVTKSKGDREKQRQINAIRVEPYYDTTCDVCGRSVSSDFVRGMAPTKAMAKTWAWEEGFRCINKRVYCPDCLREKEENKSKKNRN